MLRLNAMKEKKESWDCIQIGKKIELNPSVPIRGGIKLSNVMNFDFNIMISSINN